MHDMLIRANPSGRQRSARATRRGGIGWKSRRWDAISALARDTLDARGKLVLPGIVDIHTHYDGQATWDSLLSPSCWHGVTTVVMGNCGVGFAPVRPGDEDFLIALMEGVEDIPGTALSAGMKWGWETFPEYLDALEQIPHAVDLGTQVPHGAVRAYVMGERGAKNERTPGNRRMAAIVRAGTRRSLSVSHLAHVCVHALSTASRCLARSPRDELFVIAAFSRTGRGLFELRRWRDGRGPSPPLY